jgi:hypothetical protein
VRQDLRESKVRKATQEIQEQLVPKGCKVKLDRKESKVKQDHKA